MSNLLIYYFSFKFMLIRHYKYKYVVISRKTNKLKYFIHNKLKLIYMPVVDDSTL
jgi:hypothetical protein